MQDGLGRTIEYLRVSVTDRCNLRCRYCMPQEGITQFAHADCLTLEEIYRIIGVMADMGLKKVRFTGGEPMVRKNLLKLVGDTAGISRIRDVAMTTNGVLFADRVEEFAQAGLKSVNISLDTLDPGAYARITGRDELGKVLESVKKSVELGLKVKINCVPARELNGMTDAEAESSYLRVAELAKEYPVDVRFIELMPIGCGKDFTRITGDETLRALKERYGGAPGSSGILQPGDLSPDAGHLATERDSLPVEHDDLHAEGPARYIQLPGFRGRIGFIDPMSHRFCSECNRVRLTVDGKLKLCLYYADGLNLKQLLRDGASERQLEDAIAEALQRKPKEHHFLEPDVELNDAERRAGTAAGSEDVSRQIPEDRRMVQIGG